MRHAQTDSSVGSVLYEVYRRTPSGLGTGTIKGLEHGTVFKI